MTPPAPYKNPVPTVDIIIELPDGKIVLIQRKNSPFGWALPGGFVEYGESLEEAAVREAREETSLEITLIRQHHTYSRPERDPRGHTISTVFIARAQGTPRAADDAQDIGVFDCSHLPSPLAFDHGQILNDYCNQVSFLKNPPQIPPDLLLSKGGDRLPPLEKGDGGGFSPLNRENKSIFSPYFQMPTSCDYCNQPKNRNPLKTKPEEAEEKIRKVQGLLKGRIPADTRIGIILGTGLGGLADRLQDQSALSYQDLPFFPHSTVESHPGKLLWGTLAGKKVLVLQGRFHLYEGYTPEEIGFPIRVLAALGIKVLIIANAAGGLDPAFLPGDVMLITDQINFTGENPLIGPHLETWGPRFPDMSQVYNPELADLAEEAAQNQHIPLRRGIYVGLKGPSLETPAETRFLISLGAQAVGMSTIMEVIVAVQSRMHILGLSVITNVNRPDCLKPISIESIIQTAQRAEPKLAGLIEEVLSRIPLDTGYSMLDT